MRAGRPPPGSKRHRCFRQTPDALKIARLCRSPQIAEITGWVVCLNDLAGAAYDSDRLRRRLAGQGCQPVIPNKPTRKRKHPFDRAASRRRNVVEHRVNRLKDRRRIATRYDKRAELVLAATVIFWL